MADGQHWDNRYRQGNTPWETGHPSTELQRTLAEEKIQPCRAIDLGCGSGRHAVWLAQQGFEVVGIDISPTAIERARQLASAAGVQVDFFVADILHPPDLGQPFDFFFDRGSYHVVRRDGFGKEYVGIVHKLAGPKATGLVLTGNAREKSEPGPPVVTEEELRADWSNHFEIIRLREFRFDKNLMDDSRPLGWSMLVRHRQ
ncbi:MAG: hypothetical protein KatS3mg105_0421 [Gemmatales bacterium]|nr:MAG: hypothetical protein KatS3mg105_0421 [Gemmatales bacterium]